MSAAVPVRIQLSRRRGFRLVEASRALNGLEVVRVCRPGKWGNPFVAHDWQAAFRAVGLGFTGDRAGRHAAAVELYRLWLTAEWKVVKRDERDAVEREIMTVRPHMRSEDLLAAIGDLRGRNLACWCRPGEACHADVLLALANPDLGLPAVPPQLDAARRQLADALEARR